ncbi:hypothetical protein ABXT21_12250 [Ralstonia sp. SM1864_UCD524_TZ4]|uniref:Putative lipoprotein n=1 Tax=Ralstonia solanacearum TaxID=305 RepID=A0A0S4UPD5_RALSL|nr:hypothetical protein [Ralstonia pseudosolanacearum]CUV24064.1 putative lipoprotein [Ralstonia solanacearum]CUV36068.1 putative lipoprotein [Ralstonia solanacearum]CUV38850.1 putative lipoprotein [Ralstonia solanacearum]CUV63923.1 putative lipoprotein [Ralstonia solanacearum]
MKNINVGITRFALSATMAAVLAGCGGGGESTTTTNSPGTNSPTPAGQMSISGKAIDGYLVGAKICVDLNNNGACDAGEPSTVTGPDGSYTLAVDGSTPGKKLLAVVTPATKDLSRPGYSFPAEFTLSSIINSEATQHITPLTSLVAAQVDAGRSRTDASNAVVTLLGGSVNLNDDYIANGNGSAATLAASMVDKLSEFAKSGRVDQGTVDAVLNAIAAKGNVSGVTQADVDAQASLPKFAAVADPVGALTSGLYAYDGVGYNSSTQAASFVRNVWKYVNGSLSALPEKWNSTSWVAATPGEFDQNYGEYVLKSDGTWSAFLSQAAQQTPDAVQKVAGNVVTTVNNRTGITTTLEMRQADVSNVPFAQILKGGIDDATLGKLTGAFGAGTSAYVVEATHASDEVTLASFSSCGNAQLINEDGVDHCNYIGDPTLQYTSIDQAIDMVIPAGGVNLHLLSGGQAELLNQDGSVALGSSKIGWSKYPTNTNVIVISVAASDIAGLNFLFGDTVKEGSRIVIALHNGHLKRGDLSPANQSKKSLLFAQSIFDQLFAELSKLVSLP